MDGTRPREPLTDSALEREIETALGIEPSPEFLARVRTRIAAEPEVSSWRLADVVSGFLPAVASAKAGSRTFQRRAVEPLAAVAIVGIVLMIVVPQLMRDEPVQSRPALRMVSGDTALKPVELPPVRRQRVVQRRQGVVRTVPLRMSPALFSDADRRAFELFVVAAGEGRVPEEAASRAAGESDATIALAIEPLVIDPLSPLARVAQQGEGQW